MLSVMDFYTLIAIGIALIAFEVFIYSFILIWFAFGFIIVGVLTLFLNFSTLYWQLATVCIISLLLLLSFRKSFLKRFSKSEKEISDNFFNEKGFGIIKNRKLLYKATYWEIDESIGLDDFNEEEKVEVIEIKANKAVIKKR